MTGLWAQRGMLGILGSFTLTLVVGDHHGALMSAESGRATSAVGQDPDPPHPPELRHVRGDQWDLCMPSIVKRGEK